MFVRVARFEGIDTSKVDEQVGEMKRQIDATRAGDVPPEMAEFVEKMQGVVKRFYQLVDRQNGVTVGMTICETEEDVRTADSVLNEMTPPEGSGRRTSVELYEVVLDEAFE